MFSLRAIVSHLEQHSYPKAEIDDFRDTAHLPLALANGQGVTHKFGL